MIVASSYWSDEVLQRARLGDPAHMVIIRSTPLCTTSSGPRLRSESVETTCLMNPASIILRDKINSTPKAKLLSRTGKVYCRDVPCSAFWLKRSIVQGLDSALLLVQSREVFLIGPAAGGGQRQGNVRHAIEIPSPRQCFRRHAHPVTHYPDCPSMPPRLIRKGARGDTEKARPRRGIRHPK